MYNFNCKGLEEIKSLRNKIVGNDENLIVIRKNNGEVFRVKQFHRGIHPGLTIRLSGTGNIIILNEPIFFRESLINISSSNNIVEIKPTKRLVMLSLCITDGNHQSLIIDEDFSCGRTQMLMHEEYASIRIGKGCMFSADIVLMNSDSHCVSTQGSDSKCENIARGIYIGDKVWVGRGAAIFKNASLANGSILGAYSVLARSFKEENVALAGNPAKIVKTNITWDRMSVSRFIRETSEKESLDQLMKNIAVYNKLRENILTN